jgi:[ribosomal protein S5]-alanine N-acetyltransferase
VIAQHRAPDRIETARVIGERLRESDLAEFQRIYQDPDVMAWLGGPIPAESVAAFVTRQIEHWERYGFGIYVLRDPQDGAFVGYAGILHIFVAGVDEVEIMYGIHAKYWNKGLTTEFARELKTLALDRLALPNVVAFTLPTNVGSQRVMQKSGLVYERDIEWKGQPHVFYRALRPVEQSAAEN